MRSSLHSIHHQCRPPIRDIVSLLIRLLRPSLLFIFFLTRLYLLNTANLKVDYNQGE